MRTFLAIELPDVVRQVIAQAQLPLRRIGGLRLVRPEQCHLTLKFLGEIDVRQREEFSASLGGIRQAPFQLGLTKLGAFPSARRPRVVWLGVSSAPELAALAQAVDRATATIPLDKPFVPHLTLARARRSGLELAPGLLEAPEISCTFDVADFTFFESVLTSAGPRYQVLRKFGLSG